MKNTHTPAPQRIFTQEEISSRAQALWELKGRPTGADTEIWLEAERKLAAESHLHPGADRGFANPDVPFNLNNEPTGAVERSLRNVREPAQRSATSL